MKSSKVNVSCASVDANLPTTSALIENELFAHDVTPTEDATSTDENDESDLSPAEQIKNFAECFDRLRHIIRQFIRNRATHSAHCDWLEDLRLYGALANSKQTSMKDFVKAD